MRVRPIAIALVLALSGSAGAQTHDEPQNLWNYQLALEVAYATGDLHEKLSEGPLQLGMHLGCRGFVSRTVALGLVGRVSDMQSNYNFSGGLGPSIVVTGKQPSRLYGLFSEFYTLFVIQRIQPQRFWTDGTSASKSGTVKLGAEIGGSLGVMRRAGGLTLGIGVSYIAINDCPDGFRVFVRSGFGLSRLAPARTNFESQKLEIFQLALEPALAAGDLHDAVSENPVQLGLHMGFFRFVSGATALGIAGRVSSMQFGEHIDDAYSFAVGPGLILTAKRPSHQHRHQPRSR